MSNRCAVLLAALLLAAFPGAATPRGSRFTTPKRPAPQLKIEALEQPAADQDGARSRRMAAPPPGFDRDLDDDFDFDFDFDFAVPVPALPPVPPVPPLPPMPRFGSRLPAPPALAFNDHDSDEDDEEDPDDDEGDSDHRDGDRVYRMDRSREELRALRDRIRERAPRARGDDEDDDRDSRATGKARGIGSASLAVRGPITLQLRAHSGDMEIVSSDRPAVSMTLSDSPSQEIALFAFGDRVEAKFRGQRDLRRGKLRVEVPRGSRVDVTSMSGDLSIQRLFGEVRARTMSGDVKLVGITKADVQTISGDVHIEDVSGPIRLHTVSGTGVVSTSAPAPQLDFQSASGNLEWAGVCGRDCHLAAETVSGDVKLAVDPKSSFELSYSSHSGELRDGLRLDVKRAPKRKHGMTSGWLEATYGKGEGVIECDAFSGTLSLRRK